MFASYRGGAYSRAGTAFIGFSKQTGRSVPPRMVTFQFNINQGLALEFGNLYMRVVSNGAFVTEAPTTITGITRANPGVVSDPSHDFANGDWVQIASVQGMTQLNGQIYVIAGVTTNTYTLTDVYGDPINTAAFGSYISGGTASRIYTLVTPYADVDLKYLKFTQSADVMSLTCWNQMSGTLYPPYDLSRLADNNWTLTQLAVGSAVAAPTGTGATAQASNTLTTWYSYIVTAIDPDTGEESIGSTPAAVENNDISLFTGSNTIFWQTVTGVRSYNVYKSTPSYTNAVPAGVLYGFMQSALGASAVDKNVVPDFSQTPPIHSDPFAPGAINSITPTVAGINYSQGTIGYSITTSTGSGFAGTPVVVNGGFAGFIIENPGKDYAPGDTLVLTDSGGGVATGAFIFTTNPADKSVININGQEIEFVALQTGLSNQQTSIAATLALTLQAATQVLNASQILSWSVANYTSDGTHIYVTYNTPGTAGNAFTLGAGSVTGCTVTGGTLTGGGVDGSGAAGTLNIGPATGTYPSIVAYFQERRIYASSPNNPDTYWMSQPGAFKNFDARIPPIDTDSVTGTPWSVEVNGIQWMVSMPGGLVVLTGLGAWQLTGAGGSSLNPQPITPANQQAQPQAYNGISATVPPIRIDYDINYIQAKGSILRDLAYNFFVNIYTGTDLTYLSSQLFTGYTILEMAYCEEPYKIIWATRNDGVLLNLTYLKAQDVMAWARHDTYGQFLSVCSVTEPPVDALYLATQRYPGIKTAYMIERMDNRIWPSVENSWCVDAGLALSMPTPNATLTASSATGAGIPIGVVNLVGGSGYSSATTATYEDPTGASATVGLTILAGVITGITISGGDGSTDPQLFFTDPSGTGEGASATVVLDNSANFTASASVFSIGSVGSVIRMGGGSAIITAYLGPESVTANITSPIVYTIPSSDDVPFPAMAGNWTLTVPTTTITGLNHLIGATVTGLADGLVIAPQTVSAQGTITLNMPATAVTVGLGFTAQAQSLYLDAGQPTAQGRRKKIAAVTARLEATGVSTVTAGSNQPDGAAQSPPQIAPTWTNMEPLVLPPNQGLPPYGSNVVPLFTGDVRVPVSGGFAKPGQVAIQQTAPLPLQVLAFIPEVFPGDTPEEVVKPPQTPNPAQRRVA